MNNQPIIVNAEICRGCEECILACSLYHAGQCNPALARLSVNRETERYGFIPSICQHCNDPDCFAACTFDAMKMSPNGIAYIIKESCVACDLCREACPYNSIYIYQEKSLYLKCDLCRNRDSGPICVEVCPTGALTLANNKERKG
jgi:carbon-monoxide dehydrogenase iron sulfur subunit